MKAFDKIEIDLTESLANVGEEIPFCGDFFMPDELLRYPNAHLNKVSVNFSVAFVKPNVIVKGTVLCDISGMCDRCLDDVHKTFSLSFEQTFFKDVAQEDGYSYNGSKLDATKAVEDEIVLSLPTLLLCKPDCKGLCPTCGVNRNSEQCSCDSYKDNVFSVLKNLQTDD